MIVAYVIVALLVAIAIFLATPPPPIGIPNSALIYATSPDHRDNRTMVVIRVTSPSLLEYQAARYPADALGQIRASERSAYPAGSRDLEFTGD